LLSCHTSVELKLISFIDSMTSFSIESIASSYNDQFEAIRKIKDLQVKLHINIEKKPLQQKLRRVSFHVMQQVDEELERLQALLTT